MALVDVTNSRMDVNTGCLELDCSVNLTAEGSIATPVLATAFNLQSIDGVSTMWDATNEVGYPTVVAPTRDSFYILTPDSSTPPLLKPTDITATLCGTVKGHLI